MPGRRLIVLVVLFVMGQGAFADVIVRNDGHRFEGEIVAEDQDTVSIDTVIATIRTVLKVKRSEIKSLDRKPVPPGFFDPPRAEARVSDPKTFGAGDALYLEVPIVGRFGLDVFSEAVRNVLMYASRYRIRHIVFIIDSEGHHDVDAAGDIYRALKTYHDRITYHGVVRKCLGDALAVALMCDTLHVIPGAKIGGAPGKFSDASDKIKAEDEQVIRQQIAYEASRHMQERGKPGLIIRKMIDPSDPLACWLGEGDQMLFDAAPPDGVSEDRLVFRSKEGEILVLSAKQAEQLGVPRGSGRAADLGEALGVSGWKLESEYGKKMMTTTASRNRQEAEKRSTRFAAAVKRNVTRRETTNLALQHSLQEAAKWNPTKASYETYNRRWRWGWGGDYRSDKSNLFTQESRKKWQTLSNTCASYLRRAAQAAAAMKRLDAEALKLGLEPTYKPGELDEMITDMAAKFSALKAHREKRGK